MRVVAGLVAAFVCSAALATGPAQRTLSFDQRVDAQAAIERVYYSYQLGATKPFDEAVPRAVLENKVRKYLEQTVALQSYWKTAVTDETLQRELERMAQGTRMPERLQELYTALGNDPFLIKECLARPALVDRLTHNFYAFDPTMHATAHAQAEAIHQLLASGELSPKADHPNRTVSEIVIGTTEAGPATPGLTMQQRVTQAELQSYRGELPAVAGEVSVITETAEAFTFHVTLNETSTGIRVANYVIPKITWEAWWESVRGSLAGASAIVVAASARTDARLPVGRRGPSVGSVSACTEDGWDNGSLSGPPTARRSHTAVWTGSHMLVWGGFGPPGDLNTGGRYDPATDTWTPMTEKGAPIGRANHTAVWTGSLMVVWGGSSFGVPFNSGGRYDPATDTWTPTSTSAAPSPRDAHTAVWTGGLMVVWGGSSGLPRRYLNTGGRYDPATDAWTATSTVAAPPVRSLHTAVWTGSLMVVWGGYDGHTFPFLGGGRYNPATDSWTPTAYTNSPTTRYSHTAVWTGSLMIVWGGYSAVPCDDCNGHIRNEIVNTGGRYDPATDRWTATSTDDAPPGRTGHFAVWTGHLMLIWGGSSAAGRYDVATNSWTPLSTTGAPVGGENSSVVWTGSQMILWGGYGRRSSLDFLNTGGRYNPWTDSWTPTSAGSGPSARAWHTAVWTGSLMVVWGGTDSPFGDSYLGTGGRYDPALDNWAPTSTSDAPSVQFSHTAVWTGSVMVVWGASISYPYINGGGRYDPVSDNWRPVSISGAPAARVRHTAVWTGSRMLIWGGGGPTGLVDTGGRYDPESDSWTSMPTIGAPSARVLHSAVWTGSVMVVWGGTDEEYTHYPWLNTGGRYDPVADSWTPTSVVGTPSARGSHTANWAGDRMVVWGGYNEGIVKNGARYDPATDTWASVSMTGAPSAAYLHSAVSTGSLVMVWGVPQNGPENPPGNAIGAWYAPASDQWTRISNVGEPSGRFGQSAVWTGRTMIIWGGSQGAYLKDGGRYSLATSIDDDCDGDGLSVAAADCNDHDATIYPGAPQLCDGVNTDCLDPVWPVAPYGERDFDGDGFRSCQADCDDSNGLVYPGAPELCDGIKNNCSDPTWSFTSETDADRDGYRVCQGDCDDTNPFVHPGRPEYCDGLDNDCDGAIDEGGDALCDDGNPCVVGVCNGAIGCEYTLTTNACDDGNPCTSGDVCNYGNCGGTPVAGGACDDHNECTGGDTCTSFGGCQGTPLNGNACGEQDPCYTGGTCHNSFCGGGSFVNCDDGDICTGREFCNPVSGCLSVNPLVCDDGNICTTDSCDPATGCHQVFNDAPCDDGNACTAGDVCGDGLCLPGVASHCDDNNPCTTDACDPQSGCVHTPEPEFTYCDDYNACTGADYCDRYGTCVSPYPPQCDDHVVCTEDYCDPATGCAYRFYPAGTFCSDGNPCNGVELCDGNGGCAPGAQLDCNDNNPCTDDSCSLATGCVHTDNSNACNDSNACTRLDVCARGACVGSNPVSCAASDQCHVAGACDPASGACSNPSRPDGTVCNDASLCTTGETCQSGTCTPAFSGLNEPNPRSSGYYKRLCLGPHSGDQLTDVDAVCVGQVAGAFAGSSTVADLCAVLRPQHPNDDPCDRTSADLMVLALNICRARVCTAQSIDSQCGDNGNVGQSLAESDAILLGPSRNADTCAHAKCLDEEINTGRALELNSLELRREGTAIRLDWRPPYLDDGTGHPSKYHVWRRVQGSLAPFAKIGTTTNPTYLDTLTGSGAFEYEVTAVMN